MSVLLPIISLASLAGAAYFRPRRSANGHDKDPPRLPREDLPAIMAALSDPDPSVEVLAAAAQEATQRGLYGAKTVFVEALQRAVARREEAELLREATEGAEATEAIEVTEATEATEVIGATDDDARVSAFEPEVVDPETAPDKPAPKKRRQLGKSRAKKETSQ